MHRPTLLSRHKTSLMAGLACLAIVPLPALLCWPFVIKMAEQAAINDAALMARRALARNENISDQVVRALERLGGLQLADPCGPEGLLAMSTVALANNHVQATGFIEQGRFRCSSAGSSLDGLDLGPPDYAVSERAFLRVNRRLPFSEDSLYRITTFKANGFSAIVDDRSSFDGLDRAGDVMTGVVSTAANRPVSSAQAPTHWIKRLAPSGRAGFIENDRVVALQRSERYPYYVHASLSAAAVQRHAREIATIVLPLALVAGGLGAYLLGSYFWRRSSLAAQLAAAIKSKRELFLAYQPIVELDSQRWVGAEVLLRWRTPAGESISPAVFVPLAEQNGLMRRLTNKMLGLLADEVGQRIDAEAFYFSVNLSAEDFRDEGVTAALEAIARLLGGKASRLRIEITEHSALDTQGVAERIAALRAAGISVMIDDFGTGHSSLSYLTELQVDGLKIDKSFVDTIGKHAASSGVIPHIIEMAHTLGLYIVAEGVEQPAQADYLRERGVRYAQGWLYAKAMPFTDLCLGLEAQDGRI